MKLHILRDIERYLLKKWKRRNQPQPAQSHPSHPSPHGFLHKHHKVGRNPLPLHSLSSLFSFHPLLFLFSAIIIVKPYIIFFPQRCLLLLTLCMVLRIDLELFTTPLEAFTALHRSTGLTTHYHPLDRTQYKKFSVTVSPSSLTLIRTSLVSLHVTSPKRLVIRKQGSEMKQARSYI
jgi:hypothetical protein